MLKRHGGQKRGRESDEQRILMGKHKKTLRMLEVAVDVLSTTNPMTVRQVYYQLVSRQVIENNKTAYNSVCNLLRDARKSEEIPWDWIEDRLRKPRYVAMWENMNDFTKSVAPQFRRNVWNTQPNYLEVWLEKDALSGIFEETLEPYGVTLNVGRGYDGWSSIRAAAERYGYEKEVTVLYFGDFDPSGEDMLRSLRERLLFFGSEPEIIKCALTFEDVERFHLPPDFTKPGDTRSAAFIEKYGDMAVELDALSVEVLRERLEEEVRSRMDLEALQEVKQLEAIEREHLIERLRGDEAE